MINFSVKPNEAQIADAVSLFQFVGGQTTDAVRIAINKAGPKVRSGSKVPTNVSKEIRSQIRISASYLNEKGPDGKPRLNFKKATRSNLTGAIQTPSRGLLLSKFDWKPKVSLVGGLLTPDFPIRVRVKPGGPIKEVRGGSDVYGRPFYIKLKNSGAVGIGMWRVTSGAQGGRIKIFYGPSISQVFTDVKDTIIPVAAAVYQNELLDAMRCILAKQYPPEP